MLSVCSTADFAEIYQEIAEEDRRIAESMWAGVKETWPPELRSTRESCNHLMCALAR